MKVNLGNVSACLVFILISSSCKKIIDDIIKKPNGIASDCRITRVTSLIVEDNIRDTATISYNAKGNPISVEHSVEDWYALEVVPPNDYFKYYSDGRLAAHLHQALSYVDEHGRTAYYATSWHKYSYVGTNVIMDSSWSYVNGAITENFTPEYYNPLHFRVDKLELDNYGRVIKASRYWSSEFGYSTTYTYDADGNLVVPGITYNTTKYNYRQTSKVWMLLDRNFSINSPTHEASSYNNKKLPEDSNTMPFYFFFKCGDNDECFDDVKFTYQCK